MDRVKIQDTPDSKREASSDEALDSSALVAIDIEWIVSCSDIVERLGCIDILKKYCRDKHPSFQQSFQLIVELEIQLLNRESIITDSIKKEI